MQYLVAGCGAGILEVVAIAVFEGQAIGGKVPVGTGTIGIAARERRMMQVNNLGQYRAYVAAQRREMVKAGRGTEIGRRGAGTGTPPTPSARSRCRSCP